MKNLFRLFAGLVLVIVLIAAIAYALRRPEPRRRIRRAVEMTPLGRTETEPEDTVATTEPPVMPEQAAPAPDELVSGIATPENLAEEIAPATDERVAEAVDLPEAPPAEEPAHPEPPPAEVADTSAESVDKDEPLPLDSEFAEILEDVPTTPISTIASRNAESYLDEGNVYFNVGQYGLAIERYNQAVSLDPALVAAYYNRANALTRSGDYDEARSDYDRALELAPEDADAFNNRGMLHLYRGDYAAAIDDFNAALAIDPRDSTFIVNRGLAHLHDSQPEEALKDFVRAITAEPRDAAAHYGAGQAASAMNDKAAALRHLSQAMVLDPAYVREAAADPRLQALQGDEGFMRLLRERGGRS